MLSTLYCAVYTGISIDGHTHCTIPDPRAAESTIRSPRCNIKAPIGRLACSMSASSRCTAHRPGFRSSLRVVLSTTHGYQRPAAHASATFSPLTKRSYAISKFASKIRMSITYAPCTDVYSMLHALLSIQRCLNDDLTREGTISRMWQRGLGG